MPVILIQDFSGAGLASRLQANNDALWWKQIHINYLLCYLK